MLEEWVAREVLELYDEFVLEEWVVRVEPELYVVFLCVVLELYDVVGVLFAEAVAVVLGFEVLFRTGAYVVREYEELVLLLEPLAELDEEEAKEVPPNASSPMLVTLVGISTDARLLQS